MTITVGYLAKAASVPVGGEQQMEDAVEAQAVLNHLNTTIANPHDVTAALTGALAVTNNLSDLDDASAARTALGLGSMALETATDYLAKANNLSDVADAVISRRNLDAKLVNNGFETSITTTWTGGTLTLAITDTAYTFNVLGNSFTKAAAESIAIGNVDGLHYIYYNTAGTFVTSQTVWDIMNVAPVAIVYWNSTLGEGIPLREQHSAIMDEATHRNMHLTRGAQYEGDGAVIADYTLATSTDAGITFSLTEGKMLDEDLGTTLTAVADGGPYFVMHKLGATGLWTWTTTATIPVLTAGGGNIAWNQYTGGAWQLTEITANNTRVNYWVFGVPSIETAKQYAILAGQATYASLAAAELATIEDLSSITEISPEIVPMYRITLKYTPSGGGTSKAEIEAIADLRGQSIRTISNSTVVDHQATSNRDATAAHPASSISHDDTSNPLTGTDVQTALDSLGTIAIQDADDVAITGGTLTGTNLSNPNILINTDFTNPINQKGLDLTTGATVTSDEYTIDRWKVLHNLTTATMSANTDGLRLTYTTLGAGDYIALIQTSEASYVGKTVTLSAKIRANRNIDYAVRVFDGAYFIDLNYTGNGSWQTLTGSGTVTGVSDLLVTLFNNNYAQAAGDWWEIEWIKLEEGSVSTPWTVPDHQQELARCERLHIEMTVQAINGTKYIPFPTTMRAAPDVSVSVGSAANITVHGFELTHNAAAACTVTADKEF